MSSNNEMSEFNIAGIQQIGVGTVDFRKSWNWFIGYFGADIKILEDDTVAERMLPYTGGEPQQRHACIAVNLQGGGGFEIWQYSKRKPSVCPFKIAVGDLGIFAAKLKCRDVAAFYKKVSATWKSCTPPEKLPDGTPCFYMNDLYGNCFQLIEDKSIFINEDKLTGGMVGAVIGVTDMDRSVKFYSEVLGYSVIKCDTVCRFSEHNLMPESDKQYRRVILSAPKRKGAFAELFGDSSIELVQALERKPRKIYEGQPVVQSLRAYTDLPFDVHLMIEHPEEHVESFASAGADWITFHQEACVHSHRLIQRIHDLGKKAGISIALSTPAHIPRALARFTVLHTNFHLL